MAGNEKIIAEYLFDNIGAIKLPHIGVVRKLSVPTKHGDIREIKTKNDLLYLSTQDSNKKADIYINNIGVSLKQSGSSFSYNRLQRADILDVFNVLNFNDPDYILSTFDKIIDDFHNSTIKGRSRPWDEIFTEEHFKRLLKFLMMEGSPHNGLSTSQAKLILQAPSNDINTENIQVFTFDEYFEKYKMNLRLAIRRQWIGQSSDAEHQRAFGLAKKEGNKKWVYDTISGSPRRSRSTGKIWRDDVKSSERRTVYLIFIEKSR